MKAKTQMAKENASTKPGPDKTCLKCGSDNHQAKQCKFVGKCGWCGKDGHKETKEIQYSGPRIRTSIQVQEIGPVWLRV